MATDLQKLQKAQASAEQLLDDLKAVLVTDTPLLGMVALPLIDQVAAIRKTIATAASELES
ncbi:hypothetical protein ABIC83_002965 [Roseateles asaccharophilus]|uniref:hypothetical protein n=1 Tax=Roseateles asaccharophilus TaxID=582607 RepID=UPI0038377F86